MFRNFVEEVLIMASTAIDLDTLRLLILQELGQHALRPTDLLSTLSDRYPDTVVKEVVLRLLQEHSIEITPERQLRLVAP